MNRRLVIAVTLAVLVSGSGLAAAEPGLWLEGLPVDPGVLIEIGRFRSDGDLLEVAYVDRQAHVLRLAVATRFHDWLAAVRDKGCEAFNRVEYTGPGFLGVEPPDEAAEDFENGFVFVQVGACFENLNSTPEEALDRYTAPEFRMDVSSSIVGISPEGDRECVETKGYPLVLSPTRACNLIHRYVDDRIAMEHSQVVSNGNPEKYDTVFFKESLKAFVDLDGELAFYYVNYTRASRLGRFKKPLAGRAVSGSLNSALEKLGEVLSAPTD